MYTYIHTYMHMKYSNYKTHKVIHNANHPISKEKWAASGTDITYTRH